jgi:hypothetical protein
LEFEDFASLVGVSKSSSSSSLSSVMCVVRVWVAERPFSSLPPLPKPLPPRPLPLVEGLEVGVLAFLREEEGDRGGRAGDGTGLGFYL